jgi:hypothetical protein
MMVGIHTQEVKHFKMVNKSLIGSTASIAYNAYGLARLRKSKQKLSVKPKHYRHKNNFKLNLNLPFLQTCVSI